MVIAHGGEPNAVLRITNGERLGTHFSALISPIESRKRYMLAGAKTSRGILKVDDGAVRALLQGGSLLAVGVSAVKGRFDRGDAVRIIAQDGKEIATGLVNYTHEEMVRLCGHKSDEIESLLGYTFGDEIVHHNNMVFLV